MKTTKNASAGLGEIRGLSRGSFLYSLKKGKKAGAANKRQALRKLEKGGGGHKEEALQIHPLKRQKQISKLSGRDRNHLTGSAESRHLASGPLLLAQGRYGLRHRLRKGQEDGRRPPRRRGIPPRRRRARCRNLLQGRKSRDEENLLRPPARLPAQGRVPRQVQRPRAAGKRGRRLIGNQLGGRSARR